VGTGSYLPQTVVPNDAIAAPAGVTPEWIESRTGIATRRRAAEDEATSDLAALAGERALKAAGVHASSLGFVVVATSTPDHPQPAVASLVQHRLGAVNAGVFDLNAVCAGFCYALRVTAALLTADPRHRYGLVIGADVYSRVLDGTDRRTAPLFGDGAGAVVLGPVPAAAGLHDAHAIGRGTQHGLIRVPAGGSRLPASRRTLDDGDHYFKMEGQHVREFVKQELPALIRELLRLSGRGPAEVQHFVPHQANGRMLAQLQGDLGLPAARTHLTVGYLGNTGAASIPVTLDAAQRAGELQPGDLVLMAGFGGGMNLAAQLCTWTMVPRPDSGLPPSPS
jgi:3-oxoacyl-[acyl-carrier-protein] synthase-3